MRLLKKNPNHNIVKWTKRLWKISRSKTKIFDHTDKVVAELPQGSKVYDALEFFKPKMETVRFPAPYQKEAIFCDTEENPDWKKRILYYSGDSLIIEGSKQVLSLLKTVVNEGLSSPVEGLLQKVQLKNADKLLKRKIMSEYVWDSTQELLLPRKKDPEKPHWIFPRDYGTPLKKKILGLERQLLMLCAMAVGPISCQRHKMVNPYSKVFLEKNGETFLSEFVGDAMLLGAEPLPVFDPHPDSTRELRVPDIYPLDPTIDLGFINIYKDGHTFCVDPSFLKQFCHTLVVGHYYPKKWLPKQILARGIAYCFNFAAAQAQEKFGPAVKELPEPVSINCMFFEEKTVTLFSYQLNTLHLDGSDGVKNQIWIDGPNQLFESCDETDGVVGYDSTVFPKVLALYLHGIRF